MSQLAEGRDDRWRAGRLDRSLPRGPRTGSRYLRLAPRRRSPFLQSSAAQLRGPRRASSRSSWLRATAAGFSSRRLARTHGP